MLTKDGITGIIQNRTSGVRLSEYERFLVNSLPSDESIPVLISILDQEQNSTIKSRALDAILAIQDYDHVHFLIDRLQRPITENNSIDWRIAYCEDLGEYPDSRAVAKLCDVLLTDPDPDTRYVAAESLAQIGDASAIAALEYAQAHDEGVDYETFPIADMARDALAQIRSRLQEEQSGSATGAASE